MAGRTGGDFGGTAAKGPLLDVQSENADHAPRWGGSASQSTTVDALVHARGARERPGGKSEG